MSQKWNLMRNMDQDPGAGPYNAKGVKIPNVAHASELTPASGYNGMLWYDSTNNVFQGCAGGAAVTLSTTTSVGTLQQVTTAGATSNVVGIKFSGASSNANRLEIGDGTRMIAFYGDGTDLQAVVPAGDFTLTAADDIKLVPTGGDVSVTGNVDISGTLAVTGASTIGTLVAGTSFALGTSGSGVDASFFSTTAGDLFLWDASEKTLLGTDVKIHLGDSDSLQLGTGSATGTGDWYIESDGTDITIRANANVANQKLSIGDATNEVDLVWNSTTSGAEVTFDSDALLTIWDGVDIRMNDEDYILFGDDSDWTIRYSDGDKNLTILAGANVADQAIVIGNATNEVDILWYGTTSGDLVKFDSGTDTVIFTDVGLQVAETGAETALDVSSAATGADGTSITGSAALTDGYAALHVYGTGNIADGGAVTILESKTGTPVAGSRILELAGSGDDIIGIYADCDAATNDAYYFYCGGATASAKAVMKVYGDAACNAAANMLLVDGSNATWATNNPSVAVIKSIGTGNTMRLIGTDNAGVGAVLTLESVPADGAESNGDIAGRIRFVGQDAAHAAENAGRIDCVMIDETAANPDFDMNFYVDSAGTEIIRLSLISQSNTIKVGSQAAQVYIDSGSAHAMTLYTNSGTNSGNITINNGAASNIVLTTDTTGSVEVAGVDNGARGAQLILSHHPADNSEANDDVIARILFEGQDDNNADEEYGRIDCVVRDVANASPDADVIFYTDVAGTDTARLELNSYGVCSVNGKVSTISTTNLVLDTNESTNSGSITIANGANGDITLDPNGSGNVYIINPALAAASVEFMVPCMIRYYRAAAGNAQDIELFAAASLPQNFIIADVFMHVETADAGETITLRTATAGGGSAITDAMSVNATGQIRCTLVDSTEKQLTAAAGALYIRNSAAVPTSEYELFILGFMYSS